VEAAEAVARSLVGRTVAEVERELILDTLDHLPGQPTSAGQILGISIRTLRNKLNEYTAEGVRLHPPGKARVAGLTLLARRPPSSRGETREARQSRQCRRSEANPAPRRQRVVALDLLPATLLRSVANAALTMRSAHFAGGCL
jgi:hypothetical protein